MGFGWVPPYLGHGALRALIGARIEECKRNTLEQSEMSPCPAPKAINTLLRAVALCPQSLNHGSVPSSHKSDVNNLSIRGQTRVSIPPRTK